jgi:hypothetical protein
MGTWNSKLSFVLPTSCLKSGRHSSGAVYCLGFPPYDSHESGTFDGIRSSMDETEFRYQPLMTIMKSML